MRASLKRAGIAEIVVPFGFRFVWGPLPSEAELEMLLARHEAADHWLWNVHRKYFGKIDRKGIGMIDFCERSETIELWIDPEPNAQLTLIWLLGLFTPSREIASRLTLVQAETPSEKILREELAKAQAGRQSILRTIISKRSSRLAGLRRADA